MTDIVEVIKGLDQLLPLKPASKEDIEAAETKLKLSFAEEFKEYMYEFGAVMADNVELTGIAKSKNRNVVDVTLREWEVNPKVNHDLYVIENLAIDGIIIWQDSQGNIYESKPNCEAEKIAGSLAEYLENSNK